MGKIEEVRLGKHFRTKVHGPSKGDSIFYVPKDNESITVDDRELLKNDEFKKMMGNNINSPTNIRRIWIAYNKVTVEYFAAPVVGGKQSKLVITRDVPNFGNYVKDWVKYNSAETAFERNKLNNVTFTGRISQAIEYPYACSNLEELYFDWSALMSDDAKKVLDGLGFTSRVNWYTLIKGYIAGNSCTGNKKGNEALKVFLGADSDGELRRNYPRLKAIGFISNLSRLDNKYYEEDKFSIDSIDATKINNKSLWISKDSIKDALVKLGGDVWLTVNNNAITDNSKLDSFVVKNSQYVFDDKYLKPKLESYVKKIKDVKLANGYSAQQEKKQAEMDALNGLDADINTIDGLIIHIKKNHGDEFFKKVVVLASASVDANELKSGFSSISNKSIKEYVRPFIEGKK